MSENTNSVSKINRLVVIGLGLIGSSLAVAARNRGLAHEVIGLSRRQSTLDIALDNGIVDNCVQSIDEIAPKLGKHDVVIIGVPTLSVSSVLADIVPQLSKDIVTITDVASVKRLSNRSARNLFGKVPAQLVPGHPIAGSQWSDEVQILISLRIIALLSLQLRKQHCQII